LRDRRLKVQLWIWRTKSRGRTEQRAALEPRTSDQPRGGSALFGGIPILEMILNLAQSVTLGRRKIG
jgi:hypothetical protein